MHRKITKQKTAYTITLPIDWVRDQHLNAGDEINLEIDNDTIHVKSKKHHTKKETNFILEEGNNHYYRTMVENKYLKGFDVLNISLTNKNQLVKLQKIVANLIGMEITEQSSGNCKISETSTPSKEEFSSLLRRCFNIIKYSFSLVLEDINNNTLIHLDEILCNTNDVRRFLLFCTRTLHKISITTRENESFLHPLLERLILIQHNTLYLYEKLHNLKKKKMVVRKKVIDLLKKSSRLFDLFSYDYYTQKNKHFSKINSEWERIYFKEGPSLFPNSAMEESIILYHAINLSKLVFLVAQPNQLEAKLLI